MARNNKKNQGKTAHRRKAKTDTGSGNPSPEATEDSPPRQQPRPPDKTPRHLIGNYGMPLQVSLAWVNHNSGKQVGLVPIPNRQEGWRMTRARYRPACPCWPHQRAGTESCPHKDDNSLLWSLAAFIG